MTYRTEPSARGDVLGVLDQIKQLHLLQRSLAGGQPPGLGQNLHTNTTRTEVLLICSVKCRCVHYSLLSKGNKMFDNYNHTENNLYRGGDRRQTKVLFVKPSHGSCSSYLLEEGRILSQVLGHHVQTEEVTIDPLARHRQAVHVLVLFRSLFEQLQTFFFLNTKGKDSWKIPEDTILDPNGEGKGKGRLDGAPLTVSSLIMERTKAQVSMVQERTVSVRPSRNKRVMEASYVRQNFPLSW